MRNTGAVLVLLLLGCSPSTDEAGTEPGEEVTTFDDPTPETTGATETTTDPDDDDVSVELPGLPIGGDQVDFSEASTQCVRVNWTGDLPPEGALLTITSFAALSHIAFAAGTCGGGLPACLEGYQFTSAGGACEVAVTWDGLPLEEGAPVPLQVATAEASCPDQPTCDQLAATLEATGVQTIDIFWTDETDETDETGTDGTDTDGTDTDGAGTDGTETDQGTESGTDQGTESGTGSGTDEETEPDTGPAAPEPTP